MNNISVKLFCDEIKNQSLEVQNGNNEMWTYIGILIVPDFTEDKLLNNLLKLRCGNIDNNINKWPGKNSCKLNCGYHDKNIKEIHYADLKSYDIYNIADRWIDFVLNQDLTYFYILGINLDKLDQSYFGNKKVYDRKFRIYNRFFRTAILKSLKSYFFEYKNITIDDVFHDKSSGLESHEYFPWHSIFKIDKEDKKIHIKNDEIKFLDSDHNISDSKYSHFLQYIDIILGSSFNALHYSSNQKNKVRIAKKFTKLLSRLINNPENKNSKYKYFGKMAIDFFPRNDLRKLDRKDIYYKKKKSESVYKFRRLKINDKYQGKNLFSLSSNNI